MKTPERPNTPNQALRMARRIYVAVSTGDDSVHVAISKKEALRLLNSEDGQYFTVIYDLADHCAAFSPSAGTLTYGYDEDEPALKLYDSRKWKP